MGKDMLHRERAGSSVLRAFICKSQGRISIKYSSAFPVSPEGVVFTNWLVPGGPLIIAAGPDVSDYVALPCFATPKGLGLKHRH